jgi:simple sugar transport system substrate-binding protein
MGQPHRSGLAALMAAALGLSLAVTGCSKNENNAGSSSSGGTGSSTSSASKVSGEGGGKVVLVAGKLTDPFFGALKKGADDAARDLGVGLTYQPADISAPELGKALQAAVASNPGGIAVGNWYPKAENPYIQRAAAAGTPVVAVNAAPRDWQSTGALAFIGQSDYQAGVLAGTRLGEAGKKTVLCVNHAPGADNLEQRCNGLKESITKAGGTTSVLNIPYQDSSNPGKVQQAIEGSLAGKKDVDAIFTLAAGVSDSAVRAVQGGSNKDITVATADLSKPVLNNIKSGSLAFAIDQQPYMQGYYAVSILAQQMKYGLHLVGQVQTGPVAITKDTVGTVIDVNDKHNGIRGAA